MANRSLKLGQRLLLWSPDLEGQRRAAELLGSVAALVLGSITYVESIRKRWIFKLMT